MDGTTRVIRGEKTDTQCTNCQALDETQEHILRCPALSVWPVRYNAMMTLRSSVVTQTGGSRTWNILVGCIHQCLQLGTVQPEAAILHEYSQDLCQALQHAIQSQYALQGYLSTAWTQAYLNEHPCANSYQIRNKWIRHIIQAIWVFGDTMWRNRNTVLHHSSNQHLAESAVNLQRRHYYNCQETFASGDWELLDLPLEICLSKLLNSWKHWLVLIRRHQETTEERQNGNQDLITKVFTSKYKMHQAL